MSSIAADSPGHSTASAHPFVPLRREDVRLLTGRGLFTADVRPEGAAHVAFVRSMHANGRLVSVDASAALAMPGVIAVLTARELGAHRIPSINPLLPVARACSFDLLADQRVSWSGQPVALVVANTRDVARAAADQVLVEVDAEPAVTDRMEDGEPMVRVSHRFPDPSQPATPSAEATGGDGARIAASVAVSIDSPRLVAMALEPRAVTVQVLDRDRGLIVWLASQSPARARDDIARVLGLDAARVRVITPDVGGAFGARASVVPEDLLVPWAAWRLGRSLRWVATRGEEFTAGMHGRGSRMSARLEAAADGKLIGLDARLSFSLGAWMPFSSVVPLRNAARILPGPYRLESLAVDGQARLSNAAAVNIYRGAGRPEAVLLVETLIERAARALRIDPIALRLRNLVESSDLPYLTPTGETLDSGDYRLLLERAGERFGYAAARLEQARLRAEGKIIGIGAALYVEPCGQGWETARVSWHADGRVTVASGSPAQGQGHQTTFARIAAEALGCDASRIEVIIGDTAQCPDGIGALASRSTAIGGSAIVEACRKVLAMREADAAWPIEADARFTAREAWASGCVIAQVGIDGETGAVRIQRIVWVDDAGRIIEPTLAHGQLLGGFAQGLGQALMERIVYDGDGQLLTGSLMDYAVPRAADLPGLLAESVSHPSPFNLLGVKGVGEAGCIGVPAALMNAARDALAPFGEADLQFPLTAPRVWEAMQALRFGPTGSSMKGER